MIQQQSANVTVNIYDLSVAPDSLKSDRDEVCAGDGSLTLTYFGGVAGSGATARWYDDTSLTNLIGTGNNIVVPAPSITSTYYFRFEGSCNITAPDSVVITVYPLPVAGYAGLLTPVCENSGNQILTGNFAPGGTFSGTGISDNGDGTAVFTPATPGTYNIKYVYSDIHGCSDSISQPVTVNPLPSPDFSGMTSPVCVGSPAEILSGNMAPLGTFTGTGITNNGNGTASLSHSLDGTFSIRYYYTDLNGCSDTITKTLTVNPLPVLNVTGLETDYCLDGDPDTLSGNFAPSGTFFGDNLTDLANGTGVFTPLTTGVNNIHYTYSDLNGCADTLDLSAMVHVLPAVNFIGLNAVYDISDAPTTLVGNPAGGTFIGHGVSGNVYDPALAGVRIDTVIYMYTDVSGCTNYDTAYTDVRDYDFKAGARLISDIDNWCSVDAAYTTIGATPDESAGSCWNTGPNFNRWFRFQATTTQVKVEVKTGGSEGTLRRPYVALWDASGNELACQSYYADYSDISLGSPNLTPGDWYYISVDNYNNTGYRGTFTLCVDDSVDYDFMEGALTVPHFHNWCSAEAEFTTYNATPDRSKGSCWPNGPNYNRWFKFLATTSELTVNVKTGGTEGTIRNIMVALWDASGNQMSCSRYTSAYDDVLFGNASLTPGNWYYISVDNYAGGGYQGTFTLCMDNQVTYDFKEGAIDLPDTHEWCSANAAYTTVEATPDGIRPSNWNSGPNYNRWFKFRAATSMVRAEMKTGGDEGTLRYGLVALWDSAGNEVSSARYSSRVQ